MLAVTRAAFVAARRAARRPPPTVGLRAGFQSLTSADAALEEDRGASSAGRERTPLHAEFEAAIAASGGAEDVDALSGLGVTLAMRGGVADLRRAGELFARAVEADPSNAGACSTLASCATLGDADGAVAAWAAASRPRPTTRTRTSTSGTPRPRWATRPLPAAGARRAGATARTRCCSRALLVARRSLGLSLARARSRADDPARRRPASRVARANLGPASAEFAAAAASPPRPPSARARRARRALPGVGARGAPRAPR